MTMDLINKVVNQIRKDIRDEDLLALYCMLENLPENDLISYLPEVDKLT